MAPPSALSPLSSLTLHEDILISILSFVADVPFELADDSRAPTDGYSTLTHTLPLVSKQFHRLTRRHDFYWELALLRMMGKESSTWEVGLQRVIFEAECDELRAQIIEMKSLSPRRRRDKRTKDGDIGQQLIEPPQSVLECEMPISSNSEHNDKSDSPLDHLSTSPQTNEERLLQRARLAIQSNPPHHHTATSSGVHQCLYRSVALHHLRYQAPVFYMPSMIKLGESYGLHFFEPRYRLLIAEVMASWPVNSRRGGRIHPLVPGIFPPPDDRNSLDEEMKSKIFDLLERNEALLSDHHLPTFIHAHLSPLRRNTPAAVVQVRHCDIQPDRSADVLLVPLAYVWLEEVWERPGTLGLNEARGIRMGKEASESLERWCAMSAFGRGDGRGRGLGLPIP